MELNKYFEDVEARIDPEQEDRVAAEWKDFCDLKCRDEFFSPRRIPAPPRVEWPRVLINQALPGKSHGQRSLVGCGPWGREELDMTERLPDWKSTRLNSSHTDSSRMPSSA